MHRLVYCFFIAAADGVCDDYVRAKRHAYEKVQYQPDDGAVRAHCRDRNRALIAREIAHYREV